MSLVLCSAITTCSFAQIFVKIDHVTGLKDKLDENDTESKLPHIFRVVIMRVLVKSKHKI